MKKPGIKAILQYLLMILLTGGLLWLSLRGLNVGEGTNKAQFLWDTWKKSNKNYLLLMAAFSIVSHIVRSERWRMLIEPTGYPVKLSSSFLSLMIGYLVNLGIPRGGEVSRCYNLFKLEKTPVEISFGTVVVERFVDVLCLLALIVLCFLVEWDKLMVFINSLPWQKGTGFHVPAWIIILAIVFVTGLGVLFLLRRNEKLRKILEGFREGLLSVFKMEKKGLFIFYSLAIWGLYFVMSYCVIKAFPETEELGFKAVMTLFAIGSIAMAAPLPGGTGSYHTLVPLGLVMLYHLPQPDAIAFTFIFHAWQTLIMIVAGVISFIISYWLIQWNQQGTK
jgi:glycosyltransferase 2 family protein